MKDLAKVVGQIALGVVVGGAASNVLDNVVIKGVQNLIKAKKLKKEES